MVKDKDYLIVSTRGSSLLQNFFVTEVIRGNSVKIVGYKQNQNELENGEFGIDGIQWNTTIADLIATLESWGYEIISITNGVDTDYTATTTGEDPNPSIGGNSNNPNAKAFLNKIGIKV